MVVTLSPVPSLLQLLIQDSTVPNFDNSEGIMTNCTDTSPLLTDETLSRKSFGGLS